MNVAVDTAALHRLFYNAKLFQVGKTAKSMHVSISDGEMRMSIHDRHTYLRDKCEVDTTTDSAFVEFTPDDVKAIELALRAHTESEVSFSWGADSHFSLLGVLDLMIEPSAGDELADMMEFGVSDVAKWPGAMAINADRFRKLSLIKPGDYPVDLLPVEHKKYGHIIAFKAGPTVDGAVATMDREKLREKDGSADFMW